MNYEKKINELHSRLSSDRSGGSGAIIAVVLILIIAAVGGYFFVLNGNHATLTINVQSTHILADTDVTVYVDGHDIGTWKVDNLGGISITYDYSWSIFDEAKIIVIKAVSTGGYLGAQSDSSIITVHSGGTYKVTLLI